MPQSKAAPSGVRLQTTLLGLLVGVGSLFAGETDVRFETSVRPILKTHCWQCHGDEDEVKGGLDARLARWLRKGGDSGPAVIAHNPQESLLIERVASGEMPPGSKILTAVEQATLKAWIEQGAQTLRPEPETIARETLTPEEQSHWSFQPIVRGAFPEVRSTDALASPIDPFLLSRLEAKEMAFSDPAGRETLIRRLAIDLLGLPPTPDQIAVFLRDRKPDAYQSLVDRMLASPHYGERWARHWLDVVGYADSDGVTKADAVRSWAFKYRDYVIRELNRNRPWNDFLVEQLAGDELVAPPLRDLTQEQARRLIATGYLRMSPDGTDGPVEDQDVARNQTVAEVIKVVTTSLLGLSVGCAQCHPHRYDPISHRDYYRIRALFEPAYDWKAWRGPGGRLISQWSVETRKEAERVDIAVKRLTADRDRELNATADRVVAERIAQLPAEKQGAARQARATPVAKRTEQQAALIETYAFLKVTGASLQEIDGGAKAKVLEKWDPQIASASAKRPPPDQLMPLTETPGQVPVTYLFQRGDHKQPAENVGPGELSVLNPSGFAISLNDPDIATSGRRLAYARHLTSGRHPLVARVLVNRFWMHHFGRGLVATPSEFGLRGERPSHPRLLDWLADEFMSSGWDLKHLHSLILNSTAFRQRAVRTPKTEAVDPDNRLLGRMSVRRLESEVLRDSLLFLSGGLLDKAYGPPVPVSLDNVGQRVIVARTQYDPSGRLLRNVPSVGGEAFRRTIYIQVRRTLPLGVLVPFDLPTLDPNCAQRTFSNNAPQSLQMMNAPFVVQQVAQFAARIRLQVGQDLTRQINLAWLMALGRRPTEVETELARSFIHEQNTLLAAANFGETNPQHTALANLCQALVGSNGFLYVE
ncbi:MAG: PSD1 and planctomycete cytochrome C domain-containing protein [Planctomycetota bacterium]|nr:PSD1 and planctomycete cytochrome C domain-containing protein [Planctomycetota bacterium]